MNLEQRLLADTEELRQRFLEATRADEQARALRPPELPDAALAEVLDDGLDYYGWEAAEKARLESAAAQQAGQFEKQLAALAKVDFAARVSRNRKKEGLPELTPEQLEAEAEAQYGVQEAMLKTLAARAESQQRTLFSSASRSRVGLQVATQAARNWHQSRSDAPPPVATPPSTNPFAELDRRRGF